MAQHGTFFDPQIGLVIHNYLDNKQKSSAWAPTRRRVCQDAGSAAGDCGDVQACSGNKELENRFFGTDAVAGAHGRKAEEFIYRVQAEKIQWTRWLRPMRAPLSR